MKTLFILALFLMTCFIILTVALLLMGCNKSTIVEPNDQQLSPAVAKMPIAIAVKDSPNRVITVSLFKHTAPYTFYAVGLNIGTWNDHSTLQFYLDTTWQTFTAQLFTQNFSDTVRDARLMFWLAHNNVVGDKFFFDNIELTEWSMDKYTSNVIINPDFSEGKRGWTFYTNGLGALSIASHAACITITQSGTNVQLYQVGFPLFSYPWPEYSGTMYTLSFKARIQINN